MKKPFVGLTEESFRKLDEMLGDLDDLGSYVEAYLDAHPELVTTVQPDSITPTELNSSVALTQADLAAILV